MLGQPRFWLLGAREKGEISRRSRGATNVCCKFIDNTRHSGGRLRREERGGVGHVTLRARHDGCICTHSLGGRGGVFVSKVTAPPRDWRRGAVGDRFIFFRACWVAIFHLRGGRRCFCCLVGLLVATRDRKAVRRGGSAPAFLGSLSNLFTKWIIRGRYDESTCM